MQSACAAGDDPRESIAAFVQLHLLPVFRRRCWLTCPTLVSRVSHRRPAADTLRFAPERTWEGPSPLSLTSCTVSTSLASCRRIATARHTKSACAPEG